MSEKKEKKSFGEDLTCFSRKSLYKGVLDVSGAFNTYRET
jgi:hypothetical protein